MGLLDMRKKSAETKALQEAKAKRIKSATLDIVNSSAFQLSVLNNVDKVGGDQIDHFATTIANRAAEIVTDPVNDFMDICAARNIPESEVSNKVTLLNNLFKLCPDDAPYTDKLTAVAIYFAQNPHMYDDIASL